MPRARCSPDRPHASRRRLADDSGQAMVEMALVLPVLLFLVFGILDFGRLYNYWSDANQLASEGARYAAVNTMPAGATSLKSYLAAQASPELAAGSAAVDAVKVCIDTPNGATVGSPVHVRVTSRMTLIPFLGVASVPITGDATMRIEQIPHDIDMGCS
ncbi:MAG TPA: TadE/TadG family type IV pilus assembly protein [Baekduia sp.]|nr:TadE/TadG family type IV pilus assembly protein [Baekduia sp.]